MGETCLRTGQGRTVIDLLGTARPHCQRCRIYDQLSADRFDIGKVAGDVLTESVEDSIAAHPVFADAGISLAAFGTGMNGKACRQTNCQHITGPGEGGAIVELTGALRDKGDSAVPDPVTAGSEGVIQGFSDPVPKRFISLDLFPDEARQILRVDIYQFRSLARLSAAVGFQNSDLTGGNRHRSGGSGLIHVSYLRGSFQYTKSALRETVRRSIILDKDDRSANVHGNSGCFNLESFICVQLLLHIQQQAAFGQNQLQRVVLRCKFHAAVGIHGQEPVVIQADGSPAVLPCPDSLPAAKEGILFDSTQVSGIVLDLHGALTAQELHGLSCMAFRGGCHTQQKNKNQHQNADSVMQRFLIHIIHISFLLDALWAVNKSIHQ